MATPASPAPSENPILTYIQMGLAVLASVATGGLAADVGVAQKIAALVAQAAALIEAPELGGLAAVLSGTAALLAGLGKSGAAGDVKAALALTAMVQSAAAAVQSQAGAKIDPSLLPQLAQLAS